MNINKHHFKILFYVRKVEDVLASLQAMAEKCESLENQFGKKILRCKNVLSTQLKKILNNQSHNKQSYVFRSHHNVKGFFPILYNAHGYILLLNFKFSNQTV